MSEHRTDNKPYITSCSSALHDLGPPEGAHVDLTNPNPETVQGLIQDLHLRGGGRKMLCASTHITSAEPNSLSAGVQGPLKGPGSSRVVLMLSSLQSEPYF